ncbi:type-1 angiotensin II receptor B-like [Littorina saxatilis]|uniref:type-1 angiotensin II receptor B-like n=1 Tax=Littorina saxatilis TaxID=31220 RepID=UPI0038B41F35
MTTSSLPQTQTFTLDDHPLMRLRLWMQRIVIPLIIMGGVFGNSMMIVIVRRLKLNKSTMDRYLTSIALSDTAFLLSLPLATLLEDAGGITVRASHKATCKLLSWIFNSAAIMSAWFLVAMTIQRAVSVVWPHRVDLVCTRTRSWRIIVGITLLALLLNSHLLYGIDVIPGAPPSCVITDYGYARFLLDFWIYADICMFSFVPFAFLLLGNVVLVSKLRKSLKDAVRHLGPDESQKRTRSSEALSISVTVIVVSMSFIVLTLPLALNNMLSILYHAEGRGEEPNRDEYALGLFLQDLFRAIGYLNYALNFYLYCLTGTRFRNEFKTLMRGGGNGVAKNTKEGYSTEVCTNQSSVCFTVNAELQGD